MHHACTRSRVWVWGLEHGAWQVAGVPTPRALGSERNEFSSLSVWRSPKNDLSTDRCMQ